MYTASCNRNLQTDKNVKGTRKIENSTEFLYEMLHNFLAGKVSKTVLFNFLPKMLPGGNSVQNGPNFPAKSLSIYTKSFSGHYLIESQLNN